MTDKFIGKDYTVSDIDVKIENEWVHYAHIRMGILERHEMDDTYTAELKTGDQHDGKRVKVSGYFLELGLGNGKEGASDD